MLDFVRQCQRVKQIFITNKNILTSVRKRIIYRIFKLWSHRRSIDA